jgi:uncharacterized membrane protein YfcA
MSPLSLIYGAVVGLSLGLTGGGGAIFAVPLLVYGLDVPMRESVGISLAAVGATAFVGFLHRWRLGEVELRTGLLFALAGILGAPLGTWLSGLINDSVLLILFGALMTVVAARLWRQASMRPGIVPQPECRSESEGPACRRNDEGALLITSRCAVVLILVGIATGVLSGLFGVGGGFVIVPALVLVSGMAIHRAIGTSLMVIALVSVSGVTSHLWTRGAIPWEVAALFVAGGVGGLFVGQAIAGRLSGPMLQRVFAAAMLVVAAFIIVRNLSA